MYLLNNICSTYFRPYLILTLHNKSSCRRNDTNVRLVVLVKLARDIDSSLSMRVTDFLFNDLAKKNGFLENSLRPFPHLLLSRHRRTVINLLVPLFDVVNQLD